MQDYETDGGLYYYEEQEQEEPEQEDCIVCGKQVDYPDYIWYCGASCEQKDKEASDG